MSDKKTELVAPSDKSVKTGDGVKRSAVIGDDQNQDEFQKAHKKSHSKDQGPSDLHPAVERFGIDGDSDEKAPGGKPVDTSWSPEGGPDLGDAVRKVAGTEQEKAVLSRRHFLKLLDENENNSAEKQQVIDAMHKFEKLHRTNPKEIKEFYEQASRMMDKPFVDLMKAVPQQKRVILAEQTILQAANPDLIRQGDHNTCNVATIEYRMYSRHPAAAAKMVADLALDSKWNPGRRKSISLCTKTVFFRRPARTISHWAKTEALPASFFKSAQSTCIMQTPGNKRMCRKWIRRHTKTKKSCLEISAFHTNPISAMTSSLMFTTRSLEHTMRNSFSLKTRHRVQTIA